MIDKISLLIKRYPVNSGETHPCEDLLNEELSVYGINNVSKLLDTYILEDDLYHLSSILTLLARLFSLYPESLRKVIYTNVIYLINSAKDSVELRDNAYTILDTINDNASKAILVLLYSKEEENYLRQYIKSIIGFNEKL
jgi:hypothetical protein